MEHSCTYSIVKYVGSARGTFNFAMALYGNRSYRRALNKGATVSVGKAIYAKIQFTSAVHLNMYVQDCYARPGQGKHGPFQYDLVGPGG